MGLRGDLQPLGIAGCAARRIQVHRAGALDGFVHHLECYPGAGIARHGPADKPVVDHLLDGGRVENRRSVGDHFRVGEVGDGGGLRGVVVAGDQQHPAVGRRTVETAVLDRVAGTENPGSLAVPDGEYAVVLAVFLHLQLLGAPHRGGGQVLVDAGLEDDIVFLQVFCRALQFQVVGADRGAPVTGDVAGRIEARRQVALFLQHRQADQRLVAGHVDLAGIQGVLVIQRYLFQGHRSVFPGLCRSSKTCSSG